MRLGLTLSLALVLLGSVAAAAGPAAGAGAPLYPDLRTRRPTQLRFAVLPDGTHVLRFSNTVWNAGKGRLELEGDPQPRQGTAKQVYQNLYDAPVGGTRVSHKQVASDIAYHPTHQHYHLADFAAYLLLKQNAGGAYEATTKKGTKTSFCIMDTTPVRGSYSRQYDDGCGLALQGLTVGWGDTYGYTLDDQWVVLGARPLVDGTYAVHSTADPRNLLAEGGRDENNVGMACFTVAGGAIRAIAC